MSEVGVEIRRRREARGWTGAQLAVYAGLAPSAVSQIETGKRNPNTGSLAKIAGALGIEVGDLFPKAQSPLPLEERLRADGSAVIGEAYFVEPEEGEEPDIVTLRLYVWRELEKDDALVQKVAALLRQRNEVKAEAG